MRKIIIKILSLVLIIILVFEIYNLGKTNSIYYVSLGDFLATGENPDGKINYSYSDYLRDYLKDSDKLAYYTNEYAKSDYKTDNILSDIDNNSKLKKDLRESDLVTISIGANDLLQKISLKNIEINKLLDLETDINSIIPNLSKCLKEIRKYAKGKVIIVGYYNLLPPVFTKNIADVDKLFAFIDEEYLKLAKKYKCEYISIYQLFKNNKNSFSHNSNIHSENLEYKVIADKIIKKLAL